MLGLFLILDRVVLVHNLTADATSTGDAVAAYLWAMAQPYISTTSTSSSSTSTLAPETEDPMHMNCTDLTLQRHCKRREDCSWVNTKQFCKLKPTTTTTTATTTTYPQATISGVAKAGLAGVLVGVVAAVVVTIVSAIVIWRRRRGHEVLTDFAPPNGEEYSAYDNLLSDYRFEDGGTNLGNNDNRF